MNENYAVEVVPIKLLPHPNADSLSIVKVHGWQALVKTSEWEGVDKGAYIQPDSILPEGFHPALPRRVRAIRLRGQVSEGLLVKAPEGSQIGDDVQEVLGITHYEPVVESRGECTKDPRGFVPTYNLGNARKSSTKAWKDWIGETFVITEKIHGENWRATWRNDELHVGSHYRWKKNELAEPTLDEGDLDLEKTLDQTAEHRIGAWQNVFWRVVTPEILALCQAFPGVVFYGENYGGVKGFPYDTENTNARRLRLFDAWDDKEAKFWDWNVLATIVSRHLDPSKYLVPVLGALKWPGPRLEEHGELTGLEDFERFAEGTSVLNNKHLREGCVIRPLIEGDSQLRPVLKLVGRGYLSMKEKT